MDSRKFEGLVARAVENLPEEFRERLENIDIIVADRPTREQQKALRGDEDEILLGLAHDFMYIGHGRQGLEQVEPEGLAVGRGHGEHR